MFDSGGCLLKLVVVVAVLRELVFEVDVETSTDVIVDDTDDVVIVVWKDISEVTLVTVDVNLVDVSVTVD